PWPDAALTAFSLLAQLWMALKRVQCWLLWIAVDVLYIGFFAHQAGLLAHRRTLWTLHLAGDHGAAGMAAGAGARAMKVLVLTGPESSGKSWLAARLHRAFGGLLVDEYVRDFIDSEQRDTCLADIPAIARGQLAREDAARSRTPHLLILDTHLLS